MLRVVTWNVAGRVGGVAEQVNAVAERTGDVLVLQEVRSTAADRWVDALRMLGYASVEVALAPGPAAADPSRRLGVLIASPHPLERLPSPELPWPERHLAVRLHTPVGMVEVHGVHAPTSGKPDQVKVRTLEALTARLAPPAGHPVVVAGDLNTPRYESREGEVISFARTAAGRLRSGFDERHDRAELGVVPGLAMHGFVDVFRAVHGYAARDRSWLYRDGRFGYRLDHIFVRGLRPVTAAYVHPWRERGLSDHSALAAELA
jgi:exodeoxyribonuclease III